MKKSSITLLLFLAFFTFSCGGEKEEETNTDAAIETVENIVEEESNTGCDMSKCDKTKCDKKKSCDKENYSCSGFTKSNDADGMACEDGACENGACESGE